MIFPFLLAALAISPTATPSISPSVTSTSEIQKFREEVTARVKATLQNIGQVNPSDFKRGYLGTITKIDSNKIYLDTPNKNIIAEFNEETAFINAKSSKIKSTDLKVGQEVLTIGTIDDQNNFSAKRIIITTPKSTNNQKTVINGQVVDVSTMYSLIAMIPSSNKNTQYQIKSDTKGLQIISKTGSKLTIKDITKGKKIIIIFPSSPIAGQSLTAEKIIVM